MTAENSTKKLRTEKSKREEETALVIKTILQLVIMAAVAVLFLSGSYLTYSDSTVTIPMTGIDVLTSLFYGGEVGFVNYGKILYVSIPWYAIGAGLLIVLAAVVFAVWTAISGFAGKKDAAAVGIAQMAFVICTPKVGQTFGGAYFYGNDKKISDKVLAGVQNICYNGYAREPFRIL